MRHMEKMFIRLRTGSRFEITMVGIYSLVSTVLSSFKLDI